MIHLEATIHKKMKMTSAIIIVFLSLVVLVNGSSMQFHAEIRHHGQVSFDAHKTHQTSVQLEAHSDQPQPQQQPQIQLQPQPQPHEQPQPQLHPHHKPQPHPHHKPRPQPQPQPQLDPQPRPQPQLDPQPLPQPDPQPLPQPDPQPIPTQPQPQLPNIQQPVVQIPTLPLPTQTQMPVQAQVPQQPSSLTDMYLALATSKPQAYLNAHNMFRQKMGVPPLQWDKKLEDYAHNYGLQRAADCYLQHSHGQYGENLFWEQYDETTPEQVVKSFTDEQENFDIVKGECKCQRDSGKCMCGHFTAVIWKSTERVGCAEVKCEAEKGKLVVCSYDPPGNVPGQDPLLRIRQ